MDDFDFEYNPNIRINLDSDGFADGRLVGVDRWEIDNLFAESTGGLYTAATRAFYGINHYNTQPALPANYDLHGYTFFTRPRMRLSDANCIRDHVLMYMLNKEPLSIPRAIRAYLDPLASGGNNLKIGAKSESRHTATSPLVDPMNPFISILSNSLQSLTGWPDINVDTFTSHSGIQKEQWATYDGIARYHGTFDLNATFTNMRGDPLGLMFMVWATYGTRIAWDELMLPYIDSILDHEKDFETRIYRLIMDPTKRFVQKIACTGASFPTNANTGASFDYDANKPVNQKQATHSMSFKCQGARYYDLRIAVDFNTVVYDYNNDMHPTRRRNMTQILPHQRRYFRDLGYPWIDLHTGELQWFIQTNRYNQIMGSVNG